MSPASGPEETHRFVVVVNGLPGSGKTTLSGPLARCLGIPVVSKDVLKEALADAVAAVVPTRLVGALAAQNMWALAAMVSGPVMLESFWLTGRDDAHLRAGLAGLGSPPGVEVWCQAPHATARRRYRTRHRHGVHADGERLAEWDRWAVVAEPVSGLPVVVVHTDRPVDVPEVAARISAVLPS